MECVKVTFCEVMLVNSPATQNYWTSEYLKYFQYLPTQCRQGSLTEFRIIFFKVMKPETSVITSLAISIFKLFPETIVILKTFNFISLILHIECHR